MNPNGVHHILPASIMKKNYNIMVMAMAPFFFTMVLMNNYVSLVIDVIFTT